MTQYRVVWRPRGSEQWLRARTIKDFTCYPVAKKAARNYLAKMREANTGVEVGLLFFSQNNVVPIA